MYENYKENKVFKVISHESIELVKPTSLRRKTNQNRSPWGYKLYSVKGKLYFGENQVKNMDSQNSIEDNSVNTQKSKDELEVWMGFFREICARNEEIRKSSDVLESVLDNVGIGDNLFYKFYYIKDDVLEQGQFGEVYKGWKHSTEEIFAIKRIDKREYNEANSEIFKNDFYIIKGLSHPGVVKA